MPYQNLTLNPGQSEVITFDYTLPSGADPGTYRAEVAAWRLISHGRFLYRLAMAAQEFQVVAPLNVSIESISPAVPSELNPGGAVVFSVATRNATNDSGITHIEATTTDPSGASYNRPSQSYNYGAGERRTFEFTFPVPSNAPAGGYSISARAWENCDDQNAGEYPPDGLCTGPHNEGATEPEMFRVVVLPPSATIPIRDRTGK